MRSYLEKNILADEEFFADVDAEADRIASDLRERCLALPDPAPSAMFDHIYGEPHALSGYGAELVARVTQECFYQLEAPVLRAGGFSVPYPPSRLEKFYLPDLDSILDAVDRVMAY